MLHQNAGKPAVFLTGGIGITPIPSLIRDMTPRKLTHALLLLDSNMRREDARPFGPQQLADTTLRCPVATTGMRLARLCYPRPGL